MDRYRLKLFFVAFLFSFIVGLFIFNSSFFELMEWRVFDFRSSLFRNNKKAPDDIVVVLIDEASLRYMAPFVGRWPWPRSVFASVINFLSMSGARATVFDILFTEHQKGSDDDALLVEATKFAGNVIYATQIFKDVEDEWAKNILNRDMPSDFVKRFSVEALGFERQNNNNFYLPFTELYRAARGIGIVNVVADPDGVYRRMNLVVEYKGHYFPQLFLAPLIYTGNRKAKLVKKKSFVLLGSYRIPVDNAGRLIVNMYGKVNAFSISGVIETIRRLNRGELDNLPVSPEVFKDKIVFIGASAVGVEDLKNTSIGNMVPGVMLHISALGNILKSDFLRFVPGYINYLCYLLVTFVSIAVIFFARNVYVQALGIIVFSVIFVAFNFVLFKHNIVLNLTFPLIGIFISSAGGFATLSFTEGREKKKVRNILSQYVSPQVLSEVLDKSSKDVLEAQVGKREYLTIFFSDIRSFTSISEANEPEKVVELLNTYFQKMVDIIFKYEGTLDKFIGDAIMAFWGAPIKISDHAFRAVRAAIEMIESLDELNRELTVKGLPNINIGIGINTGEVILGNIGSEKKLDYTVIGDNVNLASRLEGLTKKYGVRVVISETTFSELKDEIPCRILDKVRVKGKKLPIRIYEPLSSNLVPYPEELCRLSEEAFDAYERGDFEKALILYNKIIELYPQDRAAAIMAERCEKFIREGVPEEWDGVYTLTTK